MSLLKFPKNCVIGKNNYIESGVKLYENVIIGNNNKIYNGTVIYPNTVIGNNNVFLNNNILGEHAVEAKEDFKEKVFNGLVIGDNNYFHVNNLIFNGYYRKTLIGNNNKILAECHLGHDTILNNNIVLYPQVLTGGLTELMDYSTMGLKSSIQQNSILGQYSMIGMGNIASHNVFPFYIYFNNKYYRFNTMKIPEKLYINNYENNLKNLIQELKENNCDKKSIEKYDLSIDIKNIIYNFLNKIKINKI